MKRLKHLKGVILSDLQYFHANLNGYYTIWENKPTGGITVMVDDEEVSANINGLDALHQGIEMDFAFIILHNLSFEGLVSLGDWIWTSADTVRFL